MISVRMATKAVSAWINAAQRSAQIGISLATQGRQSTTPVTSSTGTVARNTQYTSFCPALFCPTGGRRSSRLDNTSPICRAHCTS